MAAEILGARMHDDVGAQRKRAGENRRRHRGIDPEQRARSVGEPRRLGDVGDGPQRIGGRLDPDELGAAGAHRTSDCRGIVRVDERRLDAEAGRLILQPLAQAPVHDFGRNHVRGPIEREHGCRRPCHARGEHQAGRATFEVRQDFLDLAHGGVVGTAVGVAAAVLIVGVAQISGCQMDRRDDRACRLVDGAARLRGNCFGRHVLHEGPPFVSLLEESTIPEHAPCHRWVLKRGDKDGRPGWWPRGRAARPARCGRADAAELWRRTRSWRAPQRARREQDRPHRRSGSRPS